MYARNIFIDVSQSNEIKPFVLKCVRFRVRAVIIENVRYRTRFFFLFIHFFFYCFYRLRWRNRANGQMVLLILQLRDLCFSCLKQRWFLCQALITEIISKPIRFSTSITEKLVTWKMKCVNTGNSILWPELRWCDA